MSVGDTHEFTVTAREGEDVVTLRREEMLALIHLIDYVPDGKPDEPLLLSARRKLAHKIPKRLRPRSPGE